MRVDQMGVNRYSGLYVFGRAHVDMGMPCMSVLSDGVTRPTQDRFSKMADVVSSFGYAGIIQSPDEAPP